MVLVMLMQLEHLVVTISTNVTLDVLTVTKMLNVSILLEMDFIGAIVIQDPCHMCCVTSHPYQILHDRDQGYKSIYCYAVTPSKVTMVPVMSAMTTMNAFRVHITVIR